VAPGTAFAARKSVTAVDLVLRVLAGICTVDADVAALADATGTPVAARAEQRKEAGIAAVAAIATTDSTSPAVAGAAHPESAVASLSAITALVLRGNAASRAITTSAPVTSKSHESEQSAITAVATLAAETGHTAGTTLAGACAATVTTVTANAPH
jgi:hypothetical protein